jgi:hypothetical protein
MALPTHLEAGAGLLLFRALRRVLLLPPVQLLAQLLALAALGGVALVPQGLSPACGRAGREGGVCMCVCLGGGGGMWQAEGEGRRVGGWGGEGCKGLEVCADTGCVYQKAGQARQEQGVELYTYTCSPLQLT